MTKRAINKCVASFVEDYDSVTKRVIREHVAKSTGIDMEKASVWRPYFNKCVDIDTDPAYPSDAHLCSAALEFVRSWRSSSNVDVPYLAVLDHVEEKLDIVLSERARELVEALILGRQRAVINLPTGEVPEFSDIPDEVEFRFDDDGRLFWLDDVDAASDPAADTFIKAMDMEH